MWISLYKISFRIYKVWLWFSSRIGYIRKYNKQRYLALDRARKSLDIAFTPQIKSMLNKKYKDG